jgi:hypothetical protein
MTIEEKTMPCPLMNYSKVCINYSPECVYHCVMGYKCPIETQMKMDKLKEILT